MTQNKILVIGSNGQVASCLKDICEDNYLFVGRPEFDICNENQLSEIIIKTKPKLIINASAYTAVDRAEDEADLVYAVNSEAVLNLAKACALQDLPLIHLSTDYIFDGTKKGPYSESDIPNPLSIYGKSKLGGEEYIRNNLAEHIIIRTSWVFSPYGHNFFKTMIKLACEKDQLSIVSDQIGCPTSAHNIAWVLKNIAEKILAGKRIKYGIYNYSDSPACNWYEFASKIIELWAAKYHKKMPDIIPILTAEYKTKATRPLNSVLDCSLIKNNFGIEQNKWLNALDRYIR